MVLRRSSALPHLRAHDRLVVIVAVAVNKNPREPLLPALLRARFRPRRLLPLIDRVAEPADRVRQLGLRWHRLRRISATFAGTRDYAALVARGERLPRGRGADTLEEGLLAASRGRRDPIVGGCERDRRLIDLLDFRFWTADYLARRSQVIVKIRLATGRNFVSRGAKPVTSRCAFRGMNGILRAH